MSATEMAVVNCLNRMLSERERELEHIGANWSEMVKLVGTSDLTAREDELAIEIALLEKVKQEVEHAMRLAKD